MCFDAKLIPTFKKFFNVKITLKKTFWVEKGLGRMTLFNMQYIHNFLRSRRL